MVVLKDILKMCNLTKTKFHALYGQNLNIFGFIRSGFWNYRIYEDEYFKIIRKNQLGEMCSAVVDLA